jgi:hypothetical protein
MRSSGNVFVRWNAHTIARTSITYTDLLPLPCCSELARKRGECQVTDLTESFHEGRVRYMTSSQRNGAYIVVVKRGECVNKPL